MARALSKLGYCSRSRAGELIRAGHVQLNGATPRNPETPVRLGRDHIKVSGASVSAATRTYLMANKPRGIISTASDEQGRDTVYSLLPPGLPWVAPIGRLDKASEGLLLLTNDSEWAARILDPETHLDKIYHVQISRVADDALPGRLRDGIASEGEILRAKSARILRSGEKNCWLEIILDEGRNRQIRRMVEALGAEALQLVRVAIGPLHLGDLAKGDSRRLTTKEKQALDHAMESLL